MASTKRNNRQSKNHNPTGRNQYSGGVLDLARERPVTAAAVAAGTAAAGLFLWSKRSQISDQLSSISDQINEFGQNKGWFNGEADDTAGLTTTPMAKKTGRKGKTQMQLSEEALSLKQTGDNI